MIIIIVVVVSFFVSIKDYNIVMYVHCFYANSLFQR